MRELTRLFKALGDETRLRILKLLEVKELCVCEVEQALQIAQSRASRHLGILREAGLVTDRREGPWVVYRLRDDASPEVKRGLAVIRAWEGTPLLEADRARLQKAKRICPRTGQAATRSGRTRQSANEPTSAQEPAGS
jgi:ArsR family transcriptional regulator